MPEAAPRLADARALRPKRSVQRDSRGFAVGCGSLWAIEYYALMTGTGWKADVAAMGMLAYLRRMKLNPLQKFEEAIGNTEDVYISKDWDAEDYLQGLEAGLRSAMCEPFEISAKVTDQGFANHEMGDAISGICIAEANGYWLVYQPEMDEFVIFWGTHQEKLGAPGIWGTPLGSWSA